MRSVAQLPFLLTLLFTANFNLLSAHSEPSSIRIAPDTDESSASSPFKPLSPPLFGFGLERDGDGHHRVVQERSSGSVRELVVGNRETCVKRYLRELEQKYGTGCWNIATATFGGTQFWGDVFVHAGWRIQKCACMGHFRLLDGDDWRRAWGTSFEGCRVAFEKIRLRDEITLSNDHTVVLVHGLCRSRHYFEAMESALELDGYNVLGVNYPSGLGTAEEHAEQLALVLDRLVGTSRVSFVTHSLGGLIVRQLFAHNRAWQSHLGVGRIVMVAPPNQGSSLIEGLSDLWLYDAFSTAICEDMRPARAQKMARPRMPFGIIAGGKGNDSGFSPLLSGDDDGLVRVESTLLDGMSDYLLLNANHHRILTDPRTIEATLRFLERGSFRNRKHVY